jgi:hypothetical protein
MRPSDNIPPLRTISALDSDEPESAPDPFGSASGHPIGSDEGAPIGVTLRSQMIDSKPITTDRPIDIKSRGGRRL